MSKKICVQISVFIKIIKVPFEKISTRFRDANQILVFASLSWQYETNLEAVFCVFQQFSGSPRFRAYKNEHNLQPGALKVTKSEFLDENCLICVTLWSDGRRSG